MYLCQVYSVSLKRIHLKEKLLSAARKFRPGERPIFAKSRRFQAHIRPLLFHGKMSRGGGDGWPTRDSSTRGKVAATEGVMTWGRGQNAPWFCDPLTRSITLPPGVTDLPHARNSRWYNPLSAAASLGSSQRSSRRARSFSIARASRCMPQHRLL